MTNPQIAIVVGAGFAGLKAAKVLANHEGLRVVLVDHRNHHLFQPLLYQVATAGLNPSDIAVPIRVQFRGAPNVEIHLGHVDGVDLAKRIVSGEEIPPTLLIFCFVFVSASVFRGHDADASVALGIAYLNCSSRSPILRELGLSDRIERGGALNHRSRCRAGRQSATRSRCRAGFSCRRSPEGRRYRSARQR